MTAELLSVIVPVYNEVRTITQVLARLRSIELPIAREIVVVDDGSTDGTREALQQMGNLPEVHVVCAPRNGGKGSAVRIGLQHVRGSIVAIQDADLELDPAELTKLVAPILSGQTAVVYGSRFLGGICSNHGVPWRGPQCGSRIGVPWRTRIANRVLTSFTNLLYGASLTDMETCYKVMRTEVARSLNLQAKRFDIEPEITAKLLNAGHRIEELPVAFEPRSRVAGKKIRWRDGVQALRVLVKCRLAGGGGHAGASEN